MKKFLNAFTLLELSIVLVIIVILTSIGFDMGKYFLEQNRVKTTEVKLTKIQNALNAYLIKKGKLPCPTGLKNSDGEALNNCSITNETNGIYVKDGVARGGVPFKTLELTFDVVYDSWGNKITYSVANAATESFYRMQVDKDGKIAEGITVYNDNLNSKITENGVYAINSHGKNGLGAFDKSGNQRKRIGIKDAENINVPLASAGHANNKFVYFTNPTKKSGNTGDDFGKYATRMQMAIENEIENLSAYIDNTIINNLINNSGVTTLNSDSFSLSNNYLSYGNYIKAKDSDDQEYMIINSKYGVLNLIKIEKDKFEIYNEYTKCEHSASPLENTVLSGNNNIKAKYNYGDRLNIVCAEGYRPSDSKLYAVCEADGSWYMLGSCTIKTCNNSDLNGNKKPAHSDNFSTAGTTNYGDYKEVSCSTGYTGTIRATCRADETWGYTGNCTIKTCENKNLRTDLNVTFPTTGTTEYNKSQVKTCNTGYTGTITATCNENRSWDYEGTCTENSCTPSNVPNGYWTYENGNIASGSVLPGTTVIKKCDTGYYLDGTASYTCSKGAFQSVNLTGTCQQDCNCIQVCDKDTLRASGDNIISTEPGVTGSKFYPNYSSPTTSGTTYENGRYFANGAMVEASCTSGYEISEGGDIASTWGSHAYKCENGTWQRMGTCFQGCKGYPTTGENIEILNNSNDTQPTYTIDNIKYYVNNAVIDTNCKEGYSEVCPSGGCNTPNGKGWWTWLQCENGSWVQKGTCSIKTCQNSLLSRPHATFTTTGTTDYNKTQIGTCETGYIGTITATCQTNQTWSYDSSCAIKTCQNSLLSRPHATFTTTGTTDYNETQIGTCGTGYIGTITATCQADETWSYDSSCAIKTCQNSSLSLANTTFDLTTGTTNYNETRTGTCNSGYSSNSGSNIIATCQIDGTWSYSGSCVRDCYYNAGIDNGYWGYESNGGVLQPDGIGGGYVPYGTRIKAVCDSGYTLVGSSVAECRRGDPGVTDSGGWKWTSDTASCKQNITVTYIAVTGEAAKSTSKTFAADSSVTCNVSAFGSDPAYGTFKMCKIGNTIVGYEGDTFTVSANPTKTSKCIPYFIQNNIGSNAAHVNCASNTLCSNYAPTNEQTVYTSGSTLSGVSCATGYSSSTAPTVTCSNGTWTINNTCQQVCDSNNISLIAGSQLYKPNENSSKIGLISGTLFANGGVQDADCSSGYQEVCNTNGDCKVPGRSDNWQHFYRCENGSWKTYGSCFEGCKNDPTASSPFRKIENGYNTSPTIINGVNYYTNGAVADTDCIDGYSEICNSCYASTSNGGGSRKWNTWLQCENGSWVQKGECKKKCSNSSLTFTNATFSSTTGTTNYKETKTGTCNSGYSGSITATCGENGSWSYSGSCTMRKCSEIVVPTKKGCTSYTRLSGSYQGTCADGSKNYYCPGSKIYVRFLHGTQECAGDAFWQSCGNDYNWTYGCMSKEVSASQNTCSGSSCKNVTSTLSCTLGEASSGQTKNCSASKTVTVKASSGCDSSCGDDEISISASGTCNGSAGWRNINTSTSCTNN